jgi:rhodanese-related sulfurtransferase
MTAEALLALIESGNAPVIVDVRSRLEFDQGHVPGAIHIPFWAAAARSTQIPGDAEAPVIVYCGHGPRAYVAGRVLRRQGFSDVRYLDGHMSGWQHRGFPIEQEGT